MDEHVARAVTAALRRRGVDVVTAAELGMLSASDEDHLRRSGQLGRVFVTQDTDFLRLHAAGQPHRGIVYADQQTSIGQLVRGVILIHELLRPEDMVGHVEFL